MRVLFGNRKYLGGNDQFTKLLLDFDGADAATASVDSSASGHTLVFNGNAQLDDAQKVFGATSLLLDGSNSYVSIAYTTLFSLGTADHTIEGRFRFTTSVAQKVLFIATPDNISMIYLITDASGKLTIRYKVGADTKGEYTTTSWAASVDTWYHIAIVRVGDQLKIYINGVSQALTESTAISTNDVSIAAGTLYVGINYDGTTLDFIGWMDCIRISHIARWTANFVPPGLPYR